MTPRTVSETTIREVPLLRVDQQVREAVRQILETQVPALPVADSAGAFRGIFGEREFIGAIFPGYFGELKYAGFVTKATDEVLERRAACGLEPVSKYMNTERIAADRGYSDAQLAETFLHHRVLIIPIVEDRRVCGVVTRWDFFRALAERFGEVAESSG